ANYIAYWDFDSDARDKSGNMNHASLEGTTIRSSYGISDGYVDYGIYNYSFVALPQINLNAAQEFTIGVWVYDQNGVAPNESPYFFYGDEDYGWLGITKYPNLTDEECDLAFSVGAKGTADSLNPLIVHYEHAYANNWVFYCMTYDRGQIKAYINGRLKGEMDQQVSYTPDTHGALGKYWKDNQSEIHFSGKMDEVFIHKMALSESQIKEIYKKFTE
ncbi:MAG: LamG-like jellyroll fold domain-containing protein, partial [Candidatus Kapaibacterium sp.]